jgi:hypothetical protein
MLSARKSFDREILAYLIAIVGAILDEVIGPDMIALLRLAVISVASQVALTSIQQA